MVLDVIKGSDQGFNALLYGTPDENKLNYLQNNLTTAYQALGNAGSSFMSTMQTVYDRFNSAEAINKAKSFIYGATGHVSDHLIYPIREEAMIGQANITMQRYIMAHPEVAKLNDKSMCNGFEGTYFNMNSGSTIPVIEYRDVMDGMLEYEEDGSGMYTFYSSSDATELEIIDKISILKTWNTVESLLNKGIDPTDVDAGEL